MSKVKLRFTKAIIICHGKSECIFCKSLKSNLKLPIEIVSKDNGKSSIQLTSLLNFMNKKGYRNINTILRNYINIEHEKKKLINFKFFIIMDTDEPELTDELINNYKNKSMFKDFDYYDCIVPIYNDKNFDEVLIKLGYSIDVKNKVDSYSNVFPGKNGDYDSFQKIKNNFEKSNCSNMSLLLNYLNQCITIDE